MSDADKWMLFCYAFDEGRVSVILERADTSIDGGIIVTQVDEVIEFLSSNGYTGEPWIALNDACQEGRINFILEATNLSLDGGTIVSDTDDMFDHIRMITPIVPTAFTVEERALTAKTTVHDVRLDDVTVATCSKVQAARNIARYFGEHHVRTVDDFKALPNPVRIAFISATGQDAPNLPRAAKPTKSPRKPR